MFKVFSKIKNQISTILHIVSNNDNIMNRRENVAMIFQWTLSTLVDMNEVVNYAEDARDISQVVATHCRFAITTYDYIRFRKKNLKIYVNLLNVST